MPGAGLPSARRIAFGNEAARSLLQAPGESAGWIGNGRGCGSKKKDRALLLGVRSTCRPEPKRKLEGCRAFACSASTARARFTARSRRAYDNTICRFRELYPGVHGARQLTAHIGWTTLAGDERLVEEKHNRAARDAVIFTSAVHPREEAR